MTATAGLAFKRPEAPIPLVVPPAPAWRAPAPPMVAVVFLRHNAPYAAGESASFPAARAAALVEAGVARAEARRATTAETLAQLAAGAIAIAALPRLRLDALAVMLFAGHLAGVGDEELRAFCGTSSEAGELELDFGRIGVIIEALGTMARSVPPETTKRRTRKRLA